MKNIFSLSFLMAILASAMICVAEKDESKVDLWKESTGILYICPSEQATWMAFLGRLYSTSANSDDIEQNFRELMPQAMDRCKIERGTVSESYRELFRKEEASASTDEGKEAAREESAQFEAGVLALQRLASECLERVGMNELDVLDGVATAQ